MPDFVEKTLISEIESRCRQAEQLQYFDVEAARTHFDWITHHLPTQLPEEILVNYYLLKAFFANQSLHFGQAIENQQLAIEILEKDRAYPERLADAQLDLAAFYCNAENFTAAAAILEQLNSTYFGQKFPQWPARYATREGFLKYQIGQLTEALDAFLKARQGIRQLGAAATIKDHYLASLLAGALGELYNRLNDREKSLEAYLEALAISEKHHLQPRIGHHYLNCGRAFLANDRLDDAQIYFENALRCAPATDVHLQANALQNLGIVAFLKNDNPLAVQRFERGRQLFGNPASPLDFKNLSIAESWLAKIHWSENNLTAAEAHFHQAFELAQKSQFTAHLLDVCSAMADFEAQRGNFEIAYHLQCEVTHLVKTQANASLLREVREIETRHELEKRRQEAREAQLRLTGLQLRALRAQMNPHFLFNALNAIQGKITSRLFDEAEIYLARFAKLMRSTLEYSDWEQVPLDVEVEFLQKYLHLNQALRFQGKMTSRITIEKSLENDDVHIPTMIVQPFVENAIEHGLRPMSGGDVSIDFSWATHENMVLCTIIDNGIGYHRSRLNKQHDPQQTTHTSKGMEITRERLELLHRHLNNPIDKWITIFDLETISGGEQHGTRVEVLIPVLN